MINWCLIIDIMLNKEKTWFNIIDGLWVASELIGHVRNMMCMLGEPQGRVQHCVWPITGQSMTWTDWPSKNVVCVSAGSALGWGTILYLAYHGLEHGYN